MSAQIIRFPVERRMAAIVAAGGVARRTGTEGANYARTKGMDPREISACIRRDLSSDPVLKAACVVASVRLRRFSGGCAIDVTLAARGALGANGRETQEGRALRERAEAIRESYGYDRSDVANDYHNVRYYGSTSWA